MKKNLQKHPQTITSIDRALVKPHRPLVLWLTGLSGSGKSSIANAVESKLVHEYHAHTYLLDGDNIRGNLNRDLSFSNEDRSENIRRVGEVTRLFFDAGLVVLTAFISPFRKDRDAVRALLPPSCFWEIYINCPLDVCVARDPKGFYQQAYEGKIKNYTGIASPYEPPLNPELVLFTDKDDINTCANTIINRMLKYDVFIARD